MNDIDDSSMAEDPSEFTTEVTSGGWTAPSETIYDLMGSGARDEALWRGMVEPTPEERQAAADQLYEQEIIDNANWFQTGVMLEQVKRTHFGPLANAVLELHAREGSRCRTCADGSGYGWGLVPWPCATARVILASVDITVPDEVIYDKPDPVVQDRDNPRWPYPAGPVDTRLTLPEITVNRGGLRYPTPGAMK